MVRGDFPSAELFIVGYFPRIEYLIDTEGIQYLGWLGVEEIVE